MKQLHVVLAIVCLLYRHILKAMNVLIEDMRIIIKALCEHTRQRLLPVLLA